MVVDDQGLDSREDRSLHRAHEVGSPRNVVRFSFGGAVARIPASDDGPPKGSSGRRSRTARLATEGREAQCSSDDSGAVGDEATTCERGEWRSRRPLGWTIAVARGVGGSSTARTGSTPDKAGEVRAGIAVFASMLSTKYESDSKKKTPGTEGSQ